MKLIGKIQQIKRCVAERKAEMEIYDFFHGESNVDSRIVHHNCCMAMRRNCENQKTK